MRPTVVLASPRWWSQGSMTSPGCAGFLKLADCRLRRLEDGRRYEYTPKRGSPFTLSAAALVKRLVSLTPPPNAHLTTFHGVFAPNARLRPLVTRQPEAPPPAPSQPLASPPPKKTKRRLDWATLHQRTERH